MIEIKDLLLKFNSLLLSEEAKKESIQRIISEIIGVHIENKDIKLQNNTIYLNIKPIYKTEILLKRDKIDAKLAESFGQKAPGDIR